jgi:hypothetical protein
MMEYSRQDGISREFQIRITSFYYVSMTEGQELEPGFHTTEEQIEFLEKESGGYIHGGGGNIEPLLLVATLGLAFGLGVLSGIRIRRLRARTNS